MLIKPSRFIAIRITFLVVGTATDSHAISALPFDRMKLVTPEVLQEQCLEPRVPILGGKRHQPPRVIEVEIVLRMNGNTLIE